MVALMSAAPRAVVTGGAGFVGSHLCTRLLDAGFDVLALDNFLTGAPQNVGVGIGRRLEHKKSPRRQTSGQSG